MAAVAAVAGLASGVVSGVGGMMSANYQAQVAKNNEQVARYNAERASVTGGIEAQMKDLEHAQLQGQQITQQAASGVALSGGSQIRTRLASRMYAAGDRMAISEAANMERYGHLVEATNFKAERKSQKMQGKLALIGGVLEGIGSAANALSGKGAQFSKSLVGGSSSTPSKIPKPTPRPAGVGVVPIPRPRPIMPSIGFNPLLRNKYNFGH